MEAFSKSKYCSYWQCPKLAWLNQHRPEERVTDGNADAHMEAGREVGKLARSLFGPFVDVTSYVNQQLNLFTMLEKTKSEMEKGTPVICEAAFSFEGCYCAVDILKKTEDGWAIYEVKSSTATGDTEKVEPVYAADIAYQKYVLEHCGVSVTGTYLVNINSNYVREGELDLQALFCIRNISELVESELEKVEQKLQEAQKVLSNQEEPTCVLEEGCHSPYLCSYWNYCTKHVPKESVFDLYRLPFKKKMEYYHQGLITYQDINKGGVIKNPKLQRQINFALEEKGTYVERENIRAFLDQLTYPLYFLDFETMQPVIPLFDGTKPYQQIPFQYSLHYIEAKGGSLQHKEFLAESGENPLRDIAEALCRDIPMDVCVTAYNKAFECTRLKELARMFPDLEEHLLNIEAHIVDLLVPFQSGYYYNRAMGGSFSIKSVLPAIFPNDPELDYHSLEGVHNGSEAMTIFPKIKDMSKTKRKKARENLLKYCELDTYAMVKVWEELCEVSFDLEKRIPNEVESFIKTIRGDFKAYFLEDFMNNKDKKIADIAVIVDALYSGYLDACRTFHGQEKINKIKIENEKADGTENNKLRSIAEDIYKYLCDGNKNKFNEQHDKWCQWFVDYWGMKYGQAQKIVNMAFKYMYCVWYGKKEYKEYLEKCEVCHMPLDSFSLEWINRCYIKGKNLKKYAKDFDDTVWNQKSLKKEVYSLKQDKEKGPIGSWSTLERGIDEEKSLKCTYQFYVKLLHDELGDVSPLLVDFYVWPRMQMILSAEAFIKTFKEEENHNEDSDNLNKQNAERANKYALVNLDNTLREKLQQVNQITESAIARINISNE